MKYISQLLVIEAGFSLGCGGAGRCFSSKSHNSRSVWCHSLLTPLLEVYILTGYSVIMLLCMVCCFVWYVTLYGMLLCMVCCFVLYVALYGMQSSLLLDFLTLPWSINSGWVKYQINSQVLMHICAKMLAVCFIFQAMSDITLCSVLTWKGTAYQGIKCWVKKSSDSIRELKWVSV